MWVLPSDLINLIVTEKKNVTIDVLKPSVVEGKGAMKFRIFKNLWERRYHITNGSKFGCDFLLYPGNILYKIFVIF